jgi:hypothetical protein
MIKDSLIAKDDKNIYCPTWTQLLGKKTTCLKENCANFVPSQEVNGELFEGFCRKDGIFDALSSIMISLSVLSCQTGLQMSEKEESTEQNEPDRGLYG